MKKKYLINLSLVAVALTPAIAFAQYDSRGFLYTLGGLVDQFGQIVGLLVPILFSLGIVAFFYGIFLYIFSQSGDSKKEGRGIILWSLVAIFVMASLYGIVILAQNTLGISGEVNDFETPAVRGN